MAVPISIYYALTCNDVELKIIIDFFLILLAHVTYAAYKQTKQNGIFFSYFFFLSLNNNCLIKICLRHQKLSKTLVGLLSFRQVIVAVVAPPLPYAIFYTFVCFHRHSFACARASACGPARSPCRGSMNESTVFPHTEQHSSKLT